MHYVILPSSLGLAVMCPVRRGVSAPWEADIIAVEWAGAVIPCHHGSGVGVKYSRQGTVSVIHIAIGWFTFYWDIQDLYGSIIMLLFCCIHMMVTVKLKHPHIAAKPITTHKCIVQNMKKKQKRVRLWSVAISLLFIMFVCVYMHTCAFMKELKNLCELECLLVDESVQMHVWKIVCACVCVYDHP